MSKISVILPVYNCQEYIEKSITFVLNETFSDFELIIVNDGSTDNTSEIILNRQYFGNNFTVH